MKYVAIAALPAILLLHLALAGEPVAPATPESASAPAKPKVPAPTTEIAPAAVAKTITQARVLANGESTRWRDWKITAVPMYNINHNQPSGAPLSRRRFRYALGP